MRHCFYFEWQEGSAAASCAKKVPANSNGTDIYSEEAQQAWANVAHSLRNVARGRQLRGGLAFRRRLWIRKQWTTADQVQRAVRLNAVICQCQATLQNFASEEDAQLIG